MTKQLNEFGGAIRRGVQRMVAPNMNFVEDNLKEIRGIVNIARELQDFPTRERDRMTLRVSADRLDRALRMFEKGLTRRGSVRMSWMKSTADEIMHHLSLLKGFVAEFSGDEGRMKRMKQKANRDFVTRAVRQAHGRFAEGTTFKQFLDQDK